MIKVDGIRIETEKRFPDGTPAFKAPMTKRKDYCIIEWNYENDNELFTIMCLRHYYSSLQVGLILPYVPNARMDRVKNDNEVFTLKYFCEFINSLNFWWVKVLDVHSSVALALLNNVQQMDVQTHIYNALSHHEAKSSCANIALFYPDEGAMKRYTDVCSSFPYAFGIKKRRWEDGKILKVNIINEELITNKDVLIIDDICSRGGTFYHSAKALLEAGATSVSLYVTHCENTILEGEIFTSGLIKQVYTTNSLVHCDELKEKVIYV